MAYGNGRAPQGEVEVGVEVAVVVVVAAEVEVEVEVADEVIHPSTPFTPLARSRVQYTVKFYSTVQFSVVSRTVVWVRSKFLKASSCLKS